MAQEETVFHKIIRKEIPADIVYEDEELLAFRDINPVAPVHILVIPKKSLPSLREATPEDGPLLGKMMLLANSIAHQEGIEKTGYRVVMNAGSQGGQEVYQAHLHLIGGKQLNWPPG